MARLLAVAAVLLMMGGCASDNDALINGAHYQSLDIHNQEQSKQVGLKVAAIGKLFDYTCPEGQENTALCGAAKAFSTMIGAERIAEVAPQKFTEAKPKTSLDVQLKAAEVVGNGIPIFGMTAVAYKAVSEKTGTTNISADNSSTVSTAYEEQHATALGDTSSANNQPDQDNSSVTEIAEEEESMEE